MLVRLQSPEAFPCFLHGGGGPRGRAGVCRRSRRRRSPRRGSCPRPCECRRSGSPADRDHRACFHPRLHARSRRDGGTSPTSKPGPFGRRNASLVQANRTFEPAVEMLMSIWFITHLPSESSLLAFSSSAEPVLAVEPANARALDLDLAAVEADLASRPPPAMRLAPFAPLVTLAADRRRILLHHLVQRLDPGGKAKPLEARRHARQRFGFQRMRGNRLRCGMFLHGVAFLSWNQHPEPNGSRRATPLLHFQLSSGHPPGRPADFWPI